MKIDDPSGNVISFKLVYGITLRQTRGYCEFNMVALCGRVEVPMQHRMSAASQMHPSAFAT